MAVNFKNPICITQTSEPVFGICDDPPIIGSIDNTPAYLDFNQSEKWIAWVENGASRPVVFTAIDNCIEILRPNGDKEKSCDGMLQCNKTIKFVELKDRGSSGWIGDGAQQLKETILAYKSEVKIEQSTMCFAVVANKQRPYFNSSFNDIAGRFVKETGFILEVTGIIKMS